MANVEQLEILKRDVKAWNEWREENPNSIIYLFHADLTGANLDQANLERADLREADLFGSNLVGADLYKAHLVRANFVQANLFEAHLVGANLKKADLIGANLVRVDLVGANLKGARIGGTVFADTDLSETKGLEEVKHIGASHISTSTIQRSKGKIPRSFLRGCGLSDWEIESAKLYHPGLSAKEIDDILYRVHDLRAGQALQINPLFISYSHADGAFVDEMEKHLDKQGIRFWRDIHDAPAVRLEKVIDMAIRQHPTVLLVLSENSVKSDWVEHEARTARELEKELGRDVLCPVALDDSWKDCKWPARLREQIMEYNILDFSMWKVEWEFGKRFKKLVEGLNLFYKK
jgi:hypothetical protein